MEQKAKKPIYKKWWFWVLLILVIGMIGNIVDPKKPEEKKEVSSTVETSTEQEITSEEPEETKIPMPDNVDITLAKTVNDDVTGKWRLSRVATSVFVTDYAVAYYENYFESDDEIHIIINFSTNTTSIVRKVANLLDITVHEHVDKEECSAKTLGSGMVYGEYHVHLDTGEVEKLDLSEE